MTYSIVARDRETGRFGVAVQTCWPFVGAGVPWVESGVGAVATQSYAEVAHGPNGLAALRAGRTAPDALAALLAEDAARDVRQVGMVDADGRAACWTGTRCVAAAGHATADNLAVQANMMERATVWPAMVEAYLGATGSFEGRLLAALRAAEREGGDIRGRQSAALLISGTPAEPAWLRAVDVRVDDHPAPLDELERRLQVRPEQKEQFDVAVGATKRALLAVGLSVMEMKQRLAEELLKADPDFNRLFGGVDRAFEDNAPLFREAAREWKRLYAQLDERQVETVKRFLLDNLGELGAMPFLEENKPTPHKKPKAAPKEEWI